MANKIAKIIEEEQFNSSSIISIVISGSDTLLNILDCIVNTKNCVDYSRLHFFVIPNQLDSAERHEVFNSLDSLNAKVFLAYKYDNESFYFRDLNQNVNENANVLIDELHKVDMFFLWIDSDDSIFNSILNDFQFETNETVDNELSDSILSNTIILKNNKLTECNNNIFLSTGIKNKKIIASILSEDYKKVEISSNILFRGKRKRTWIIDKEAGSMLW